MAAYAPHQRESAARGYPSSAHGVRLAVAPRLAQPTPGAQATDRVLSDALASGEVIDQLLDRVAVRIAATVADRLGGQARPDDDWFDSRHAAEYLGVHRDTLRKLAAERAIPSEQDGRGCKLYFRRSDLDGWRRSGGRPRHLASTLASVA